MRSTTKFATVLSVTVALALIGLSQSSVAQTISGARADSPAGSVFQDQGIRDDNGDSPRAGAFESYGRTPQRSRPAPVAARASANSDASNLSGYSARPEGMCWERTGAGGHELNGHWAKCRSH